MTDYFSTIMETMFFLLLSAGFLNQKINIFRFILSLLPISVIKVVFLFAPVSQQIEFLSSCTNIILGIMGIMILTKSGIKTSLFCYIGGFVFGFIFQLILVAVLPVIGGLINLTDYMIAGSLLTFIIAVIAYKFFDLHRLFSFIFDSQKWGTILLINIFTFSFIISLYFKLDSNHFLDVVLFLAISFYTLITINIVLFNQYKKLRIQSQQLSAYKQYLPVLDSLIENVRIKQHNHKNELQSIIGLMYTYRDYDSLTQEMKKYIDVSRKSFDSDYILKINMHLVAGFLYHKKSEASRLGITIKYTILSYKLFSIVPEYELIEFFGILIDNAVDATPTNGIVHVTVDSDSKKVFFITRNVGHLLTAEDRTAFFKKGYSGKNRKDRSGLGLYHLRKSVSEQYHGQIYLWNDGTDILFKIIV